MLGEYKIILEDEHSSQPSAHAGDGLLDLLWFSVRFELILFPFCYSLQEAPAPRVREEI